MREKKVDAVVIGAGPAGASAARTLVAGGMKPLLIEKRRLPRHKMCSGILSHWSVGFVHRRFGPLPAEVFCRPNFLDGVALHFPSLPVPVVVPAVDPIPNVWRSRFDHFLVQGSGAEVRDGHELESLEAEPGGFRIVCTRPAGTGRSGRVAFRSKYVVAADGNNSRSIRRFLPEATRGLPRGTGMQVHYRGEVDLDPGKYHMFFHLDMGFYAWASVKDDDIHVGVGGFGNRRLPPYHARFVSLLERQYGLRVRETTLREGMTGVLQGPINVFTLGKGNFLAAGDAAGFVHNGGEGISCALATGDLAAQAVLSAERTDGEALTVYRDLVRGEVDLCLDQFNLLRLLFKFPMRMDFPAFWRGHSLGEMRVMWKDLKAYAAQDHGLKETGIGRTSMRNMFYRLRHGRYPVVL